MNTFLIAIYDDTRELTFKVGCGNYFDKRCLKRELERMEDFKNDPDYYLCGEGSKQAIEAQKTMNRIEYYSKLLGASSEFVFWRD